MNITAEFSQGQRASLFRLTRRPVNVQGHILYLPALFEQANQTRHMLTRSAINAYQQGFESIILDHYGTGDSEGELIEASLSVWQQDIIAQLNDIKKRSEQPIFLSVSLSAALLLNNNILAMIDGLILVQPEFNGKRYVQQLKRLALAADLNKRLLIESLAENVTIAGYVMDKQLLDELTQQKVSTLTSRALPYYWLEWQVAGNELSIARAKQYQAFQGIISLESSEANYSTIDDIKFWQSSELVVAERYLELESKALTALFSIVQKGKAC